jgi:Flp pilus assembly protein TadG
MFMRLAKLCIAKSRALRDWRNDHRGNVTVFFALSILPFTLAAGAAVDFQRVMTAKSEMTQAMETAAIYAATMSATTTDAQRLAAVQTYVNNNYGNSGNASLSNITVTNYSDHVAVSATATINSAFMQVAGITNISVPVSVEVQKAGINLEVSLVLDNTGSMNTSDGSTPNAPITDLKAAAANFVNTVMPATQGAYYTKIALVPYNNSVNLGTSALATTARGSIQSGTSSSPGYSNYTFSTNYYDPYGHSCSSRDSNGYCKQTLPITNCVTERTGSQAYTDASVSTYPVGRAYLGSNNPCTVTTMVPLSTDASTLVSTINNMSAGNSTAGQVGIAWGWYALSPNIGMWTGSSIPAGYDKLTTSDNSQKVKKIMILMTDGEYNSANYNGVITGNDPNNGSYGNPYYGSVPGSGGPLDHINQQPTNGDSYTQSTSMCNAIKASGVEVYVISFQLNTSIQKRVDLVNNCATDANHVLNASDQSQLNTVFANLANSITSLYVSK